MHYAINYKSLIMLFIQDFKNYAVIYKRFYTVIVRLIFMISRMRLI